MATIIPSEEMSLPHGTGRPVIEFSQDRDHRLCIPNIRLRLWLSATRLIEEDREVAITESERKELNSRVRDAWLKKGDPRRNLDEPWELRISDGTNDLVPELHIRAWMAYRVPYDGQRLLIMHEMPWLEPYKPAPASELKEGSTIIAEEILEVKDQRYDVRLFIHWPKQEQLTYTFEEALEKLKVLKSEWTNYQAGKHEIEVLLGHNGKSAWKYKFYPYADFPEQFIADIMADEKARKGLDRIAIQPHELYEHYRHHSEDYQIIAKRFGLDDYEDGYVTKRKTVGERVELEIKND